MIISAQYAVLSPTEVIREPRLEISGRRIVSISSGKKPFAMKADFHFPTGVIMPGLVNPHCHLELEFCSGNVPYNGSFIDWLQRIRDLKAQQGEVATVLPLDSLSQLARSGCTTVVDHYTMPLDFPAIRARGLRYVPLREVFGFNDHLPDLAALRGSSAGGFAPHAPYTASIETCQACRELANTASLPLSVHLAEFPAETRFIRDGEDHEIAHLLELAGQVEPTWQGSGLSPVAYLAEHGVLSGPTYVIHANYPEQGDIDILRELGVTVVFCPRSHAFFQHSPHPIEHYLAAGIPVAIGTDSLASNERLSPLHEAALLRKNFPAISSQDLLKAMTSSALEPLGWDSELGKLEVGWLADLAVFAPAADPGSGLAELLNAAIACAEANLTVSGGEVIHSKQAAL